MAGSKKARRVNCSCVPEGLPSVPPEVEEGVCKAGGLDAVARSVPRTKELNDEARLHSALSDPVRLLILHSLERCDLCPCLLKEITGLADSKLSYHLGVLEDAGLIRSSAVRRWRVYLITNVGKEWVGKAAAERPSTPVRSSRRAD